MQYDIDGGNITVIVGEEARLDVPTALNYIKSGQAEIGETVDAGIDAFDLNAANKTTAYDNNASAKLAAYNDNATDKTNAFNLNASGKTGDFNDNYTLKKAAVDASADAAAASATLAQQWAVKMDGKVADEDYSAKYYADLAAQSAGATGANTDLSNLTPTGEAKFTAKQDVIDADHKLSYNYLSDTPDLSAYVTTNTAQTITGVKTFNAKIYTAPIEVYPLSDSSKPYIDFHYDGNNIASDFTSRIIENTSGELTLQADKVYVPTSTQTTSKSSAEDANIAWVNSTGNNVVHLDSDETITGLKTIRRSALQVTFLDIVNGSITNGVRPSENAHSRIYFSDKDAHATACIYDNFSSNGDNGLYLQALKSETVTQGTDRHFASMGITYPASGNPYGIAPASDVNYSIVTTVNKSKAQNGYFQFGNGLIIQWGYSNKWGSSQTVTFPKAFTTTNYAVTVSRYSNEWAEGVMMQTNNYKTTSFDLTVNDPGAHWIAIGY